VLEDVEIHYASMGIRFDQRGPLMPTRISGLTFLIFLALLSGVPTRAAEPSFADLLDRAGAELAAGRRWEPPGDNLADTIMTLFKLAPTATPQQLAAFADLLERDRKLEQADHPEQPPSPVEPPAAIAALPPEHPAAAPVPPKAPARSALLEPAPTPAPALAPIARSADAHAAELYARGKAAEQNGDISGARRFYASAAERGSSAAALALGRLYDPAFLGRTVLGGIDPDPGLARQWYQRAADMGDREATPLLQALTKR
jgi:TPR repeat protein